MNNANRIISCIAAIVIGILFISVNGFDVIGDYSFRMIECISDELIKSDWEKNLVNNPEANAISFEDKIKSINRDINSTVANNIPIKRIMTEVSGLFLKLEGNREYYGKSNNIYLTKEGYCIGKYDYTTTDYEVSQVTEFKNYLDSKGIDFLYVNEPAKYIDDEYYSSQFGGKSYLNDNMDRFLDRISQQNVKYLDLRECVKEQGIDPLSQFYKADHHWTVPAAKWAACEIVKEINRDFEGGYNTELFDDSNYQNMEFKQAWIGEQGKKVSKSYAGMEDYTVIMPLFDTDFTVDEDGRVSEHVKFDSFINKDVYLESESSYVNSGWHYSYNVAYNSKIYNNYAEKGKVLVLGDSYEKCLIPFLCTQFKETTIVVMRESSRPAREIVDEGDYDMVIMAYAQFMVGAHDKMNVNYNMFSLN